MKRTRPVRRITIVACAALLFLAAGSAQEAIDRVVARIESAIILQSEVQLLSHYQLLVDGKSQSDADNLDHLIDQWVVRNEAAIARTPQPSDAEIERGLERLQQTFASKDDYDSRRKLAGLSENDVKQLICDQLYLNNYLDSRFRPTVQVDEPAIRDFYQTAVVARAQARGQSPPALETAHDYILEALIQKGINEQADRWLKESRTRLHVTKMLEGHP
jgi:hypothetical protein